MHVMLIIRMYSRNPMWGLQNGVRNNYRTIIEMFQNCYINCIGPQVNSAQRKYRGDSVRVTPEYYNRKRK